MTAERRAGLATFHVVRGELLTADRYACGARRELHPVSVELLAAASVVPNQRCLRMGCSNDFAKADREARRAAEGGVS